MRFADFTTISRSITLPESTNVTQELLIAGTELLTTRLPARHLPVRLLGIGVSQFDDTGPIQQHLFDQGDRERLRESDSVSDQITARFGKRAIRRGAGLPYQRRVDQRSLRPICNSMLRDIDGVGATEARVVGRAGRW